MLQNKTVLIIGSSGYLGKEITNLAEAQNRVFRTHFRNPTSQTSVRYDFFNDSIEKQVDLDSVDLIIFTGMVEFEASDRVAASVERFAQACRTKQIVYLSSDGIFDGEQGNYSESDIPKPRTLYGRNLKICEGALAKYCRNLCIVRPSYIYGFSSAGALDSRISKTRQLLEAGETVTLFNDMYKSPLGVHQVANAVLDLARLNYNGIVHVAGERLSVFDFQYQAMKALNVDVDHLKSCPMPINQDGFLRDTSLNNSLWKQLTATNPNSITETLANMANSQS